MTEQQLEAAARKLCEIRGINPEASVSHGAEPDARGFIPALMLYSPAWRIAAREVLSFYQVVQAVEHAMGDQFP